jgi:mannose/fructose/N-acetylgalactosamine-specific phosphotransferase system component IID
MYSAFWLIFAPVCMTLITTFAAQGNFVGAQIIIMNILISTVQWHPVICILSWIFYGIWRSSRRDVRKYEVGL